MFLVVIRSEVSKIFLDKERIKSVSLILLKIIFYELVVISFFVFLLVLIDIRLLSVSMLLYIPFVALLIVLVKFIFGYYIILFFAYCFNYKEIYKKSISSKALFHLKIATLCLVTIFSIDFIFRGSLTDNFFTDSLNITLAMFFAWISSFLAPLVSSLKNR